jgi:hypothetical protein
VYFRGRDSTKQSDQFIIVNKSWNDSVTDWTAGIWFLARDISFRHGIPPVWGLLSLLANGYLGLTSPRKKQLENEARNHVHLMTKLRMPGAVPPFTIVYVFME